MPQTFPGTTAQTSPDRSWGPSWTGARNKTQYKMIPGLRIRIEKDIEIRSFIFIPYLM